MVGAYIGLSIFLQSYAVVAHNSDKSIHCRLYVSLVSTWESVVYLGACFVTKQVLAQVNILYATFVPVPIVQL